MTEQLSDVHFVMQNDTTTGKVRVLILFYCIYCVSCFIQGTVS